MDVHVLRYLLDLVEQGALGFFSGNDLIGTGPESFLSILPNGILRETQLLHLSHRQCRRELLNLGGEEGLSLRAV